MSIEIIRGNNYPPIQWQFLSAVDPDVLAPLDGSVFKLTYGSVDVVVLSSDVDAQLTLDLETSTLTWAYTVADSRALPVGQSVRYEIERWLDGTQQTLVRDSFNITDGFNPD